MNERELAKKVLKAVWEEDLWLVTKLVRVGADPNWLYNGYPLIFHAIEKKNAGLVMLLVDLQSQYLDQALWFAIKKRQFKIAYFLFSKGALPRCFEQEVTFATPQLRVSKYVGC
ncbi:MAG: ankyrin repeat domain-containing protein [Erysipelotrichaceae bacterium]